jgi:hypothetical protein
MFLLSWVFNITYWLIGRGLEFCSVATSADMSCNRFKFTDFKGTALPPAFVCVCLNLGQRDMVHSTSSKNGRGHRSCGIRRCNDDKSEIFLPLQMFASRKQIFFAA